MVEANIIKPEIYVFKTNLTETLEIKVRALFSHFNAILKVDFDFEDCDNILRIEALKMNPSTIEFAMNTKGFYCKELM